LTPTMMNRRQLGWMSEERACEWFLSQCPKARLIAKNYQTRWGEIDLIFEEWRESTGAAELIFVEVRSRSNPNTWVQVQPLSLKKQARLQRTAHHFLASSYRGSAETVRFDYLGWDSSQWVWIPDLRLSGRKNS
jgi:putative endonuclease